MAKLSQCGCLSSSSSNLLPFTSSPYRRYSSPHEFKVRPETATVRTVFTTFASKSNGSSLFNLGAKSCQTCRGQGAIECPGCKGTGKNKKNGNIFERWKCYDCQGFGLKSCPNCGKGGLTPEQRGER